MSKIEQKIKTHYFKSIELSFGIDDGGSLKDEFDSINLDIKKLEINNNEFGIKVKVLYEDKVKIFDLFTKYRTFNGR